MRGKRLRGRKSLFIEWLGIIRHCGRHSLRPSPLRITRVDQSEFLIGGGSDFSSPHLKFPSTCPWLTQLFPGQRERLGTCAAQEWSLSSDYLWLVSLRNGVKVVQVQGSPFLR